MRIILVLSILFYVFCLNAQSTFKTNLELEDIARRVVNDSLVENRTGANDTLKVELLKRLSEPNATSNRFEEFTAVSVQGSKDDKFRIFSWQLYINPDVYRHEGIIQFMESGEVVVLKDQSQNIRYPDGKELTADKWFGALYYNIIPFKVKGSQKYLLFGFDGATRSENCKIVDVLNINKNGALSFGAPLFHSEIQGIKQEQYRYFHQYDQNVKAVLNYDPDKEIIIYDHLIPWTSKEIGVGLTYVPDGSYEGFELKRGAWKHIEKVFDYKSEVPVGVNNPLGKKVE